MTNKQSLQRLALLWKSRCALAGPASRTFTHPVVLLLPINCTDLSITPKRIWHDKQSREGAHDTTEETIPPLGTALTQKNGSQLAEEYGMEI